jgi:hypothetical protein
MIIRDKIFERIYYKKEYSWYDAMSDIISLNDILAEDFEGRAASSEP